MSYNRSWRKKIISYVSYLFLLSLILVSKFVFAQNKTSLSEQPFIDCLQNYFHVYYSQAKEDGVIKPQEQVLNDIKKIASDYLDIDKKALKSKDNFDDLSILLDEYLKKSSGKSINIFTVSGLSMVNCWLGDLTEEKIERKNIWGQEIQFSIKVIDTPKIQDFAYFLSGGQGAFDAGSRDSIIYYNLQAYKIRAACIWDFFAEREKENKNINRRYDSSKANRLRKHFYHKAWSKLYLDCTKDSLNLEQAKKRFINEAVVLLRENSLVHEIGHIYANKYLKVKDASQEETIAFLSELRFGILPYDSLDTVISASYQSSMENYNLAGREITSSFISYIKNEQLNKNQEFKNINIQSGNQWRKMNNLFRLTENQIRSISEYIYEQRFKKE